MIEKLSGTKPQVLEAWMVGAGIMGFGLGALLAGHIQQYALWIFLIGLVVHFWAMYKIYR